MTEGKSKKGRDETGRSPDTMSLSDGFHIHRGPVYRVLSCTFMRIAGPAEIDQGLGLSKHGDWLCHVKRRFCANLPALPPQLWLFNAVSSYNR
jgi:hypothetical protein